jgi:UDP-N-acetylmuramoyl-tripeptide--D-alanyl-D-alanine ligase
MRIFLFFILGALIGIRWLRWLGVVQQKEYRWHRLRHFIRTDEGQRELIRLFPQKADFSRTGLKRPRFTLRIGFIAIISLFLMFIVVKQAPLLFSLIIIWFLVPLLVLAAVLPSGLIHYLVTLVYTCRAQQLINQVNPTIIGITGSFGKTSTKLVLQHVLSQKFSVFTTQKSFNTRLSLARDICQRYSQEKLVIIEFAAYRLGEIAWLAKRFQPHLAVITGLTDQHLGLFGSREKIVEAKSELVQALPKDAVVFINAESPGTRLIARKGRANRIQPYCDPDSNLAVTQVKLNDQAQLCFSYKDQQVKTRLVGKQYLAACCAAIQIAQHLGLSQTEIMQGLKTFNPVNHFEYFVQFYQSRQGFWVLDDGRSSNPAGFKAALQLAVEIEQQKNINRIILITAGIVDLGSRSEEIHAQLARQARPIIDKVFYLGQPGRSQFQQVFTQDLSTQVDQIKHQLLQLGKNDMVVIEGLVPLWLKNYLRRSE